MLKICAYVQQSYAKANYKNECLDTRLFYGLRVVIDALQRAGYHVEYAGKATVHSYDIVLVSITANCDWYTFIRERLEWVKGDYKVIVGGAGCLHVVPFLHFADFFVLGRGECSIIDLLNSLDKNDDLTNNSIVVSKTFDAGKTYMIAQSQPYEFGVNVNGKAFTEKVIGCNHKCLFCGYTWQRKFCSPHKTYNIADNGFFGSKADRESAILDMEKDGMKPNFSSLMTTAIDGFSERLRFMVNKKITKDILCRFFISMIESSSLPRILKLYNICGYPTETDDDWIEFIDTAKKADNDAKSSFSKKRGVNLHTTPFKPMPATPMACAPIAKKNFRGAFSSFFGNGKTRNIAELRNMYIVESIGTEGLSTVMLEAVAMRGEEKDTENIIKLCKSKKFWGSSSPVKEATLCKYFDMDRLFGQFDAETLPSRYLRTYAAVEKFWRKPFWEKHAK